MGLGLERRGGERVLEVKQKKEISFAFVVSNTIFSVTQYIHIYDSSWRKLLYKIRKQIKVIVAKYIELVVVVVVVIEFHFYFVLKHKRLL